MQKDRLFTAARSLGGFFLFTLSLLLTAALALGGTLAKAASLPTATDKDAPVTVVIDAGHGGEDGGAVGVTGVLEKDLNMQLSLCLAASLREAGVNVVLTRTEDKLLYTEAENIKGIRKLSDLKNRCKIAAEYPDAIFISIHMNSYSNPKYSGLQVYYSESNDNSRILASHIQSSVKNELQASNNRTIKAGEGMYILENIANPGVLIECGFLTNFEECEKLSEKEYRKQLSLAIICGIIDYKDKISSI